VLAILLFRLPPKSRIAESAEGFVALAVTLLTYGLTELLHGYGFLAVFIAARVMRRAETDADYHHVLHDFAEAVERLLSAALLVLLGGPSSAACSGRSACRACSSAWPPSSSCRPLTAMLSMVGHRCPGHERSAIAFFGIRGIGSGYYLAYALGEADFAQAEELWAIVVFVVLLSILLHGVSASPGDGPARPAGGGGGPAGDALSGSGRGRDRRRARPRRVSSSTPPEARCPSGPPA
jgi:NhaP-type Na+/H+ or K+/H+ antiporter